MKKKPISLVLLLFAVFAFSSCTAEKEVGQSSLVLSDASSSQVEQTTEVSTVFETEKETSLAVSESAASVTSTVLETTLPITTTEPERTELSSTAEEETTEAETKKEEPESSSSYCTVTIDCRNAKKNISQLKKNKRAFVPESGYILKDARVEVSKGDTAFDVFKRACAQNVCTDNCKYCQKSGIQTEYSFTPAYNSYYIEGIHQLYEKDCGSLSGWMFSVNGVFPDVSSSAFEVKAGDLITFAYTVSMGDDL